MSQYVDGFVLPLPKDRIEDYRKLAEKAAQIWKEHGALEYWECLADDLEAKEMRSFGQLADTGPDETVVFAWVVFASREQRDQANAKIMADPRIKELCDPQNPPFNYQRMAYGGFKVFVHA